jgi:cellulose biosynthesis protein BcsQ
VPIRTDAQISKSQSKHLTVFEYDPVSKGAKDYMALAGELLSRWEARV